MDYLLPFSFEGFIANWTLSYRYKMNMNQDDSHENLLNDKNLSVILQSCLLDGYLTLVFL